MRHIALSIPLTTINSCAKSGPNFEGVSRGSDPEGYTGRNKASQANNEGIEIATGKIIDIAT